MRLKIISSTKIATKAVNGQITPLMNEIITLIRLSHTSLLYEAIMSAKYDDADTAEDTADALVFALMHDDTFNEYTGRQLRDAVNQAIADYNDF